MYQTSTLFQQRAHFLEQTLQTRAGSLYQTELEALHQQWQQQAFTATSALQWLQDTQRLEMLFAAHLEHDASLQAELASVSIAPISTAPSIPVATEKLERLAELSLGATDEKTGRLHIDITFSTRDAGAALLQKALERGDDPVVTIRDDAALAAIYRAAKKQAEGQHPDAIDHLDAVAATYQENIARQIFYFARAERTALPVDADAKAAMSTYRQRAADQREKRMSDDIAWTLSSIPEPEEAKKEGLTYEQMIELFFDMVDQPLDAIETAQRKLVDQLDAGKELRFVNDDGTDFTLSIEDFDFISDTGKGANIPGTEVFSSPQRHSANGVIVAKGRYEYNGHEMEDITLTFKDGQVVDFDARIGRETLEKILRTDEGARYIGEIAFGTNPHLKRQVTSIALVEKVGGSFHVALGASYTMTEDNGRPRRVHNGNKSQVHWDITTMLHGRGGEVWLDGQLIQKDGKWVDPAYAVLNCGWAALPAEQIPDHWVSKLAEAEQYRACQCKETEQKQAMAA